MVLSVVASVAFDPQEDKLRVMTIENIKNKLFFFIANLLKIKGIIPCNLEIVKEKKKGTSSLIFLSAMRFSVLINILIHRLRFP